VQFFVAVEKFTCAYLFQIALEIIWLPIQLLRLKEVEVQPVPSRRMSNILTYVRVELVTTTGVQSLLEIPATDEILMEDRNHGLAWTKPNNGI